jgi:hypothetical protein
MVRNPTAALVLVAVLLLASSGFASAQSLGRRNVFSHLQGSTGSSRLQGSMGCPIPATTSGTAICPARAATTNTA